MKQIKKNICNSINKNKASNNEFNCVIKAQVRLFKYGNYFDKNYQNYDQEFCSQTTRTTTITKHDYIGSIGLPSNGPKT